MYTREELNALNKEDLINMVLSLQVDTLTGFYTRQALTTMNNKDQYVVALVDINNLKTVNDNQGHDAGDQRILSVCDSIRNSIRSNDMVIRYGGDEFVIVFNDCTLGQGEQIVSRIKDASCGVACDSDLDVAIKLADAKMYENKLTSKKVG